MAATPTWLAVLEAVLNRGLSTSAPAAALARRLDGTALHVIAEHLIAVRVGVSNGRLALTTLEEPGTGLDPQPVNATITGSSFALLQLASGAGGGARAGRTAAQVRGDAEVADQYRKLFALARPDAEEEISRVIGDWPARRLSLVARGALTWAHRARRTVAENVAEYLQEESRDLVNKTELEEFLQGVDVAREAADRVEARLARLERRQQGPA